MTQQHKTPRAERRARARDPHPWPTGTRSSAWQDALESRSIGQWNAWRHSQHDADAYRSPLGGAYLHSAISEAPNLSRADLSGADITGRKPQRANLTDARLRHAVLRCADLSGADLTSATSAARFLTQRGSHCGMAPPRCSPRSGPKRERPQRCRTSLARNCAALTSAGAHLSRRLSPEYCSRRSRSQCGERSRSLQHGGPSSLGIDTIYMSGGKIPRCFSEAVGVPESFIVQNPSPYRSCPTHPVLLLLHQLLERRPGVRRPPPRRPPG